MFLCKKMQSPPQAMWPYRWCRSPFQQHLVRQQLMLWDHAYRAGA